MLKSLATGRNLKENDCKLRTLTAMDEARAMERSIDSLEALFSANAYFKNLVEFYKRKKMHCFLRWDEVMIPRLITNL